MNSCFSFLLLKIIKVVIQCNFSSQNQRWLTCFEVHNLWHFAQWQSVSTDIIILVIEERVAAISLWGKKYSDLRKHCLLQKRTQEYLQAPGLVSTLFWSCAKCSSQLLEETLCTAGNKLFCGWETEILMVNNSINCFQKHSCFADSVQGKGPGAAGVITRG